MANDTFTLDVDQASELKHAAKRNGVTNADLKALSSGDMFARILPVLRGYGEVVVKVLQFVGEVLSPRVVLFIAGDHFVVNTKADAQVKIVQVGSEFESSFLDKIEADVRESRLVYGDLENNFSDHEIVQSLGGESKAETYLAEVFWLMSLQPNHQKGDLLTNGLANIFYVRDSGGMLHTVVVGWTNGNLAGRGWYIGVGLPDAHDWSAGSRVFGRK